MGKIQLFAGYLEADRLVRRCQSATGERQMLLIRGFQCRARFTAHRLALSADSKIAPNSLAPSFAFTHFLSRLRELVRAFRLIQKIDV